jgi:hypothetical protein
MTQLLKCKRTENIIELFCEMLLDYVLKECDKGNLKGNSEINLDLQERGRCKGQEGRNKVSAVQMDSGLN